MLIFGTFLTMTIGAYLFPDAQENRLRELGVAYIFTLVFLLTLFSLVLVVSLVLFLGLWKKRKELVANQQCPPPLTGGPD